MKLKVSNDSKVGSSFSAGGSQRFGNSFGLPAGKAFSCPSATSVCEKVCYAGKLERLRPNVKAALMHNFDLLRNASEPSMVKLLDVMVTEFEVASDKWGVDKMFRIHWDGDFFSDAYTRAWATVITNHPNTQFWVYTRVQRSAYMLRNLPNLALYFSMDSENAEVAKFLSEQGIKIASLGDTFEDARQALGARAAMCPEQRGQLPLKGACVACKICIKGSANILFSISSK